MRGEEEAHVMSFCSMNTPVANEVLRNRNIK